MLDKAFETLKTYDWGQDRNQLKPIDEAVVGSYGDAAARKELETKLAAVLTTDVTYDAKQFVCRQLMVIGTAASVPTLAGLLGDKEMSHMARYALERIEGAEAGNALRDSIGGISDELKVGVISSLGVRGEDDSVNTLKGLSGSGNAAVAKAAVAALGAIRSKAAAAALASIKPTDDIKAVAADASLACAESLLKAGDKAGALAAYKRLLTSEPSKQVKLAATRGMLACSK
jgi:HEAT repeat protein